jgi:hypothetical protein
MSYQHCNSETVRVTLLHSECQALDEFIEKVRAQTTVDDDSLCETQEMIAEARAVATWLRENVTLVLPSMQGIKLFEHLPAETDDDQFSGQHWRRLVDAAEKIRAALLSLAECAE